MNTLKENTLAKIVMEHPSAATAFEKYGLDFCCQGKRTLEQACEEAHINAESIEAEIQQLISVRESGHPAAAKFDAMPLDELCNYIVSKHHGYVKQSLPLIYAHTQKVAAVHGDRHPEAVQIAEIFSRIKEDFEQHMRKEEMILFPYIQNLMQAKRTGDKSGIPPTPAAIGPITVMEQEHENAGNLTAQIRGLSNNYTPPAGACTTFRLSFEELKEFEEDLHKHVHLENNILFPKALQLEEELQGRA